MLAIATSTGTWTSLGAALTGLVIVLTAFVRAELLARQIEKCRK